MPGCECKQYLFRNQWQHFNFTNVNKKLFPIIFRFLIVSRFAAPLRIWGIKKRRKCFTVSSTIEIIHFFFTQQWLKIHKSVKFPLFTIRCWLSANSCGIFLIYTPDFSTCYIFFQFTTAFIASCNLLLLVNYCATIWRESEGKMVLPCVTSVPM